MPGLDFQSACFAYVGPGAGLELTPYSWGLLAWIIVAVLAVLAWPLTVLYQRLRKGRAQRTASAAQDGPADRPHAPVASGQDRQGPAGGNP